MSEGLANIEASAADAPESGSSPEAFDAPVLARVPDFAARLRSGADEAMSTVLRRSETVGRPLGDDAFRGRIKAAFGRDPRPRKRGPRERKVSTP